MLHCSGWIMNLTQAVSKRFKQILEEKGLSQYRAFKITGIPQSTISTIIAGKVKTIKLSTIHDFCNGLNIEISEFFNTEDFKIKK